MRTKNAAGTQGYALQTFTHTLHKTCSLANALMCQPLTIDASFCVYLSPFLKHSLNLEKKQ